MCRKCFKENYIIVNVAEKEDQGFPTGEKKKEGAERACGRSPVVLRLPVTV